MYDFHTHDRHIVFITAVKNDIVKATRHGNATLAHVYICTWCYFSGLHHSNSPHLSGNVVRLQYMLCIICCQGDCYSC